MPGPDANTLMRSILQSDPALSAVVRAAPRYRLQAVLGLIETGSDGRPVLVQQGFRLGAEYFYPASSVKLFAAVAALEKLETLRRETGLNLTPNTALVYEPLFAGETIEDSDPSNLEGGTITVAQEIRKIFLVSNNQAFNHLYELVGQDGLAQTLRQAGLPEARIVHRLSESRTAEENRRAPAIEFRDGDKTLYRLPERTAEALAPPPPMTGLEIGSAYMQGGRRVEGPMNFSGKNRVALADLQRGLCMVVRPDIDCGGAGFDLSAADREFLLRVMKEYPRQSSNPALDASEYPDDYVKSFLPGLIRALPEERLEVYSKSGEAYGFATDNAWVVDKQTGRSFFLAATLYANSNGVLNDDTYDYETVSEPFLANLAEAVARRVFGGETLAPEDQ